MPSLDSGFSSSIGALLHLGRRHGSPGFSKHAKESGDRIVEFIHNPLLKRNDSVLGNGDLLRANFPAAGGDVAVPDAMRLFYFFDAVLDIERVRFERGDMHEKARPGEFVEMMVLAQHVAYILA